MFEYTVLIPMSTFEKYSFLMDKLILQVNHILFFLIREFDPEFRLVAKDWLGSGNVPSRLYFGVLDFKNGREIYAKVNISFKIIEIDFSRKELIMCFCLN